MTDLYNGGLTHRGYEFLLGKLKYYSYELKGYELDKMISVLKQEKERRRIEEKTYSNSE